jgi:hypothetical protein
MQSPLSDNVSEINSAAVDITFLPYGLHCKANLHKIPNTAIEER